MILPITDITFAHTPLDAQQLSTILTHKDGRSWLYEHYIDLYFSKDYIKRPWEGFLDARKPSLCPFVIHNSIQKRNLMSLNQNVLETVCRLIDLGNYILIPVNQYYIKNYLRQYKKQKSPHHLFIFGFNKEQRRYKIADFFSTNFSYEECSQKELLESIQNCNINDLEPFDNFLEERIFEEYLENINFFSINHSISYTFNREGFKQRITKFLDSQPPSGEDYIPFGFRTDDYYWGMSIFEGIGKAIIPCFELNRYFTRPVYMIYMFSRILNERIVFMARNNEFAFLLKLIERSNLLVKKVEFFIIF